MINPPVEETHYQWKTLFANRRSQETHQELVALLRNDRRLLSVSVDLGGNTVFAILLTELEQHADLLQELIRAFLGSSGSRMDYTSFSEIVHLKNARQQTPVQFLLQYLKQRGQTLIQYVTAQQKPGFLLEMILLEDGICSEDKALKAAIMFRLFGFFLSRKNSTEKRITNITAHLIKNYNLSPNAYHTLPSTTSQENLLQHIYSCDSYNLERQAFFSCLLVELKASPDFMLDIDENFFIHKLIQAALTKRATLGQLNTLLKRDDLATIRRNQHKVTAFDLLEENKDRAALQLTDDIYTLLSTYHSPIFPTTRSAWVFHSISLTFQVLLTGFSIFDQMSAEAKDNPFFLEAPSWVALIFHSLIFELTIVYPGMRDDYRLILEADCHTRPVSKPTPTFFDVIGYYFSFFKNFCSDRLLGRRYAGVKPLHQAVFVTRVGFYFLFYGLFTFNSLRGEEWRIARTLSSAIAAILSSGSLTLALVYAIGEKYYQDCHNLTLNDFSNGYYLVPMPETLREDFDKAKSGKVYLAFFAEKIEYYVRGMNTLGEILKSEPGNFFHATLEELIEDKEGFLKITSGRGHTRCHELMGYADAVARGLVIVGAPAIALVGLTPLYTLLDNLHADKYHIDDYLTFLLIPYAFSIAYTGMSYERDRISRTLNYCSDKIARSLTQVVPMARGYWHRLFSGAGYQAVSGREASHSAEEQSITWRSWVFSGFTLTAGIFVNGLIFILNQDKSSEALSDLFSSQVALSPLLYAITWFLSASAIAVQAGALSSDLIERSYALGAPNKDLHEALSRSRASLWNFGLCRASSEENFDSIVEEIVLNHSSNHSASSADGQSAMLP